MGALLLLLLSLAMLSESLRLLWYSVQNIREGLSNSLMWLIIFTDLPQLLLLWMAGVPAVGAALHALFWRQGEGYRLRTSRLFALFALAGAALLVVMMGLDPQAALALWQRGVIVAQGLSLVLCLWLLQRTLRRCRHREAASKAAG